MSFLYPRVVTISRPNPTTGIGALPYQGLLPSNETVLFSNIPAAIQHRGNTNAIGLPADAKSEPCWVVIIPGSQVPLSGSGIQSIQERDIFTDDLGNRYQVYSGYWNSLGYQAECEKLQT
jgi:hypothetical protein